MTKTTIVNDIALIRLNEAVPLFSESTISNVIPICLPWPEDDFARNWNGYERDDAKASVTGWGWIPINIESSLKNICEYGVGTYKGTLRVAEVEINNKQCQIDFPRDFDPKRRICVGKGKFRI